jgi:hypothetical protein
MAGWELNLLRVNRGKNCPMTTKYRREVKIHSGIIILYSAIWKKQLLRVSAAAMARLSASMPGGRGKPGDYPYT